eukprot:3266510-Rhodomonas_salina.2
MLDDNDEDIFTYFEEYVETAGEQFDAKQRFTAMQRFAARCVRSRKTPSHHSDPQRQCRSGFESET